MNTGALAVETSLEPGKGYFLPKIGVINTGDEVTTYAMSIGFIAGQPERKPDDGWFSFNPQRFTLEPGQSRDIDVSLTVPTGANPGDYFVLVRAGTTSADGGQARVGVAAATKVSFSIESSSWLDAQRRQVDRWLYVWSPWTYLIPAGLLLAFLATKVRRLPFRLKIERK